MTLLETQSTPRLSHDGYATERPSHDTVNVGSTERLLSATAGGVLAILGIRSRSLPGLLAAAAGGAVYRGASGHCPSYSALGINTARHEPPAPSEYFERGIHVAESLTVNRTPWELYQFWRNFDNLPRFMEHVESIKVIDDKRSQWVVQGPAGRSVEWEAEIINEEPNSLIAWRRWPAPTWTTPARCGSCRHQRGAGRRCAW